MGFEKALNGIMEFLAIESVQSAPCPSSPFGEGVGRILEKFASLAKSMGFTVHNEDGYYVTADIGEGEPFAILGHLDTVPLDTPTFLAISAMVAMQRSSFLTRKAAFYPASYKFIIAGPPAKRKRRQAVETFCAKFR